MVDHIGGIAKVSPADGVKLKKQGVFGAGSEATDDLSVSSFAREMAGISNEMAKIPEVRQDKVDDLKNRIENGKYAVDTDALARRLVWAGITRAE
jgi:negative regulator of flagellin synthesis FlgM